MNYHMTLRLNDNTVLGDPLSAGVITEILPALGAYPIFLVALFGAGRCFGRLVNPGVACGLDDCSGLGYHLSAGFVAVVIIASLAAPEFNVSVLCAGDFFCFRMNQDMTLGRDHYTAVGDLLGAGLVAEILLAVGAIVICLVAIFGAGGCFGRDNAVCVAFSAFFAGVSSAAVFCTSRCRCWFRQWR